MAIDIQEKKDDSFITTKDNPHNPFTNFTAWFKWDSIKGYNTCCVLDKLSNTNPMFSEEKNEQLIDIGMLRMIALDFENKYIIVHPNDYNGDKLKRYESFN